MDIINYELLARDYTKYLGLIVLQSDVTIEDEFRYYYNDQPVSLMVNRIPFENEVTAETLKQMEGHIGKTMSLFPIETEFDSVGYGCTSGSLHIGGDKIAALISETRPSKSVSNPLRSALAAFDAVGANNVAYLGPYSEQVCGEMINHFVEAGINVSASASYDEAEDRFVGRISPESILRDAVNLVKANPQVEAVFVSCTNMKCAHVIPEIEKQTGKVALSSNQVLAWHMARQVGLTLGAEKGILCR
ncbi:MAG: maleate isomerase [Cocleimonas sp.]|jgi:maleate isomerase